MCGIVGFVAFGGHCRDVSLDRLKRMTDAIVHRGPDAEGFYVDEFAALGHRRLSIIDLEGGRQPMGTADHSVQIVFNGEIYNFLEIRAELEARGQQFYTRSDTEVILRSYIEWGDRCVERLWGMFAFAIWDKSNQRLFLARDRVGKKPLYYHWDGKVLSFASEIKALIAGNLFERRIDSQALDCYLGFGYVPAPRSIFRNVKKLPSAHSLTVSKNNLLERKYWSLRFGEYVERNVDEASEEFDSLLDRAVQCRLMSEVPLGAFLSGGLDSTLVVSSMASLLGRSVITNSIGFGSEGFNELPVARKVAKSVASDHHEFIVEPNAAEVLETIAWHFDEPFADSSAVPTWYVCRMARQNVTVALSGDGGDESFAGYTFRYIPHLLESTLRARLPVWFRELAFGTMGAIYPGTAHLPRPFRLKTILKNLAVSDAEAFYRDLVWLRPETREALYTADFLSELHGFTPFEAVRPYYTECGVSDPLARSQNADIHFYMTDDVLVKVDRMSMAHSLEVRCPLLDHRILEFAARLPIRLKTNRKQGKLLLRQSAAKRLPPEVRDQPKRGFSIPAARWLREDLRSLGHETIFRNNALINDVLKPEKLAHIWDEHQSGSRDHSVFLWGLMMLGLWERTYFA